MRVVEVVDYEAMLELEWSVCAYYRRVATVSASSHQFAG